MTLYLHLGAHKTATTLIQNTLKKNRQALIDQNVFYQRGPGRHPFWHYFQDGDLADFKSRCAEMRARFHDNCTTYRNVIFSSETTFGSSDLEGVSRLYPDADFALDHFVQMTEGLSCKLIFYVRRPDDFIQSTYINRLQTITGPWGTLPPAEWASFDRYLNQLSLSALNWHDLLTRMADRFGKENIIVRPFEAIAEGRTAYLQTFCANFCDPDQLDLTVPVMENRSFSNVALQQFREAVPHNSREALQDLRRTLQESYPSTTYAKPKLMSDAQKAQILDTTQHANDALFADFISRADQKYHYSRTSSERV